jgi:hypothetical protein
MIDITIGMVVNYIAFTLIGAGPSLYFAPPRRRFETAIAIAPVIGFALTSVFGTYLVLLDKPVSSWAMEWLIISVFASFTLLLSVILKERNGLERPDTISIGIYVACLLGTTTLLSLPYHLAGVNFTMLRGNGFDAFYYVSVAGYLDAQPYSWALSADFRDVIDLHPTYFFTGYGGYALKTRWTTMMIMAWTSRIAGISLIRFEYGFSLIPLMLSFGPAFLMCRALKISLPFAALTASCLCVGFWPQLVLDIRSASHLASIPHLLLLSLLTIWIAREPASNLFRTGILLSIVWLSLLFHYIEIFPLAVLQVTVFIGLGMIHGARHLRQVAAHTLSLALTIVLSIPAITFLVQSLIGQIRYAATAAPNSWGYDFFGFLYSNPFTGLWGLSIFSDGLLRGPLILFGVLLSGVLTWSIVYVVFFWKSESDPALRVAISFIIPALAQFFFLLIQWRLWGAGKAITFGYPFIMLAVAAFAFRVPSPVPANWNKTRAALMVLVSIWLTTQIILGGMRSGYAYAAKEYPNYKSNHGEYRRNDWDLEGLRQVLKVVKPESVGLAVGNRWITNYLDFSFGRDFKLIYLEGIFDPVGKIAGFQRFAKLPEYLIVSRDKWIDRQSLASKAIAGNANLALLKLPEDFWLKPVLLVLHNPKGIESHEGETSFWMGGDETLFRVYSPEDGEIFFNARFRMGPGLPEQNFRTAILTSDAKRAHENLPWLHQGEHKPTAETAQWAALTPISCQTEAKVWAERIQITEQTEEIRIPVVKGVNEITIRIMDRPTLNPAPGGDISSQLLQVGGVRIVMADKAKK